MLALGSFPDIAPDIARTPTAVMDLQQSPFDRRSLIEASAGTGKTWTLSALYLRLLLERRLSVREILVVTFTKAATAELRQRIRARLAELLALYQGRPCQDEFLHALYLRYSDETAYRRVLLAVHGFDEAAIFTIHGFCGRALQDAAFEAAADFDNELQSHDEELALTLLTDLWRQELAAAEPLWAAWLAHKKVTPKTLWLALKDYLSKPWLRLLPPPDGEITDIDELWLNALFAQTARLWQEHGEGFIAFLQTQVQLKQNTHKLENLPAWGNDLSTWLASPTALFNPPDKLEKLTSCALLKATKKDAVPPAHPLADYLQDLHQAITEALSHFEQRFARLHSQLLMQLNRLLPQRKAAQRVLAFDDLLGQLFSALSGASGQMLAAHLRDQYPLALIDEFQDTDPTQFAIFNRIYPLTEDLGEAALCLVGDPKQAIYAFRGADLQTYLGARQSVVNHYELPSNYRSRPELIAALNALFEHPLPFAQIGLDYPKVNAADKPRKTLQLPEHLAAAALNLVWLKGETLNKTQATEQAVTDCAARIAAILAASRAGKAGFINGKTTQPIQGGDMAVLVGSHKQADIAAKALSAQGVASVLRSKQSVWRSEEATELFAVLCAYAEPSREGLLRYALLTRLLGRSAEDCAHWQTDDSAFEHEQNAAALHHQHFQQLGFMRAFRHWLVTEAVAERLLSLEGGERRLTNLLHLAELLQQESLKRPSLSALLLWFDLRMQDDSKQHEDAELRLESDAERVQIVTIHSAKGLEYPLVFCPFLWDGKLLKAPKHLRCHADDGSLLADFGSEQFEQNRSRAEREIFAEKLRLAYVAMTRARDSLWLYCGAIQVPADKKKPAKEGLHSSALGWLLYGTALSYPLPLSHKWERGEGNESETQPFTLLGYHLADRKEDSLCEELALRLSSLPHSALLVPFAQTASHVGASRAGAPFQLCEPPANLGRIWRIGSFSGLTFGVHRDAPDRDSITAPALLEPGTGFFAFPRGARAGICLHSILEDWARDKDALPALVEQALKANAIDPKQWTGITTAHLQQVLDTNLNGQGLSLSALTPAQRLPELGFCFPLVRLSAARLQRILSDPAYGLPEPMRKAAQQLDFETLQGFLKGFIDLTFEWQGRWYIADYKSNWLGSETRFYQDEHLAEAIAREHYYLQYLIYLIALRRFLRVRLGKDEADKRLGGAFYLFLRGMPQAGCYFHRPQDNLLDALDDLFVGAA